MAVSSSVCFSCHNDENIFNIYDTHICEDLEEVYAEMLKWCFDISIPRIPNVAVHMCEVCIMKLRDAYYFKHIVLEKVKELESLTINTAYQDEQPLSNTNSIENDPESHTDIDMWFLVVSKEGNEQEEIKSAIKVQDSEILRKKNNMQYGENKLILEMNMKDTLLDDSLNVIKAQEPELNSIKSDENQRPPCKDTGDTPQLQGKRKKTDSGAISDFVCEVCGKKFAEKLARSRHLKTHLNGPFPCNVCGKEFIKLNSRNAHVWRVHTTRKIGSYVCSVCAERFSTFHKRLVHLQTAHNRTAQYPCPYCDNMYSYAGSRSQHIRSKHLKVRNHKCANCNHAFFKKRQLSSHLATVHGIGEKPHVCHICNKSYYRSSTLKTHLSRHLEKYICNICNAGFSNKVKLKTHLKKHEFSPEILTDQDASPKRSDLEESIVKDEVIDGSNDTVYFEMKDDD